MKWFKHYTNAHKGSVLQDLYEEFGINEGHGLYFRLTEFLADKWDGCSEPRFRFFAEVLRNFTHLSPKKFQNFIGILSKCSEIEVQIFGKFIEIYFPKLANIRHKDAIAARLRPAHGPALGGPRRRREEKREEEEEKRERVEEGAPPPIHLVRPGKFNSCEELVAAMPLITMDVWRKEYGAEFLAREISLAIAYYSADAQSTSWEAVQWASRIGSSLRRAKTYTEKHKAVSGAPETGGWGHIDGV